ncbi:MAG: membrane dipeptidase [Ruminococcus sp.]|nr:membrane dipeptidase [Ruminococcus sp.]
MDYFDLHCDTVTTAFAKGIDLASEKLQVNVKISMLFKNYRQCFALWLNDDFHGKAAFKKADELYNFYQSQLPLIEKCVVKPMLTLENAVSLGGELENIALWKSRGVCAMSLTWNGENELACGADVASGGLTALGKKALHEAENQGIVIDVSHLNEDGFCDVSKIAHKPFIASHSNCFSVCPHKRNLKDYQIKEIIACGGLIGINFYPVFLGSNVFEAVYENICHIISFGGENSIAFGSDFDGAKMSRRLKNLSCIPPLRAFLLKKGMDSSLLDKFFSKNSENFFNNVLHNQ